MIYQVFTLAALVAVAVAWPYQFGYNIKDKEGEQYRQEEGFGGVAVRGSYGFTDIRGIRRDVEYVADKAGFRAQIKTNEPGTANQNPAAVGVISDTPYAGTVAVPNVVGYKNLVNAVPAAGYGRGYGLGYGRLGNDGLGLGLGYGGYGLGGLGLGSGLGYVP